MKILTKTSRPITSSALRWDAHSCPPFKVGSDLSFLNRYKNAGVNFISLNVGFDLTTQTETLEIIYYFQQWITEHSDEFSLAYNVEQLLQNKDNNKLTIGFDIEGSNLLNGSVEMISDFYALGVRQMLFTYNTNNDAGGGCLGENIGLTSFGKQLVEKCNQVGMVIDCSHVGYRTSMDIIELSKNPVVFSHSNPRNLIEHPRNISDEQIIACAKKGGVIGINGIGIFLGGNNVSTENIVKHIDYVTQLVGSRHIGIGLDCVFAEDEIKNFARKDPEKFPSTLGYDSVASAQPEQFSEIGQHLAKLGYSENDVNNILGENFLRVAKVTWR